MEAMQDIVISWQECLAVIFGLAQVLLAYKNNPINYLFGIAGIILTIYVLFEASLYAEVSVNIYYLIMSIYGWWLWIYKKNQTPLKITNANMTNHITTGSIVLGSLICIYFLLVKFTDSTVPFWDALSAAFAYGGMYLLSKRKIENWIYLNISNAVAIPLLIYKEVYLFAGFTAVLFIIAVFGYFNWKKIKTEESPSSELT